MKYKLVPLLLIFVAAGCGSDKDINKDLKPINPDAKLEPLGEAGAKSGGSGIKAPPVIK